MSRWLVIVAALVVLCACTPYPRYGVRPSEYQPQTASPGRSYTTNDYLRLGMILRGYLGRPYGSHSEHGDELDCSIFTQEVMDKFDDISLPRTVAEQFRSGREVQRSRLILGDLVFFRTDGRLPSHVGLFVGENSFIHASSSRGIIITSLMESYWAKRYLGARRIFERTVADSRP